MQRSSLLAGGFLALVLPLWLLLVVQVTPSAGSQQVDPGTPTYQAFLPSIFKPVPTPTFTPTPTHTPTPTPAPTTEPPPVSWDPRLDLRQATLVPANIQPGQGYWKVIKGVWYDVNDFHPMGVGDHDIAFDVIDASGVRQVGKTMKITWAIDGSCTVSAADLALEGPEVLNKPTTLCIDYVYAQAKPGEPYAGTYPMYHVAPTYRIQVDDGKPSEAVDGLGMGSIQQPNYKIHTSYGFVWRWTIASTGGASATPTGSPGPTRTPSPTRPTNTPTVTPTGTPVPLLSWDPRLTQRGAVLVPAQVSPGQGYWRLTTGKWYDVTEQPFANQGLILVDTLDATGARQVAVAIQISDLNGAPVQVIQTEAKPGELYAANFPMWQTAPAYIAQPQGAPADAVFNMGLGSLSNPNSLDATRYGLVWQWTIAPGGP
jgi:hypothetical protein